jgi:hypothetical protein
LLAHPVVVRYLLNGLHPLYHLDIQYNTPVSGAHLARQSFVFPLAVFLALFSAHFKGLRRGGRGLKFMSRRALAIR